MVKFTYQEQTYECIDDKTFFRELQKEGIIPINKKDVFILSAEPEVVKIIAEKLIWFVNMAVLNKIIKRLPDLFKKKIK